MGGKRNKNNFDVSCFHINAAYRERLCENISRYTCSENSNVMKHLLEDANFGKLQKKLVLRI